MQHTTSTHRVEFSRIALSALALVSVIAAMFVGSSSAQVANPEPGATKTPTLEIIEFLDEHGVKLPANVIKQYKSLTVQEQHKQLIEGGVDRSLLMSDVAKRPMPLVAELLRVLDPDAPRPEIASDEDYAQSMLDVSAMKLIDDLQEDYSSRLGFARWDTTAEGKPFFVIPIVAPTDHELTKIEDKVLHNNTPIRVESTDISYHDLSELQDAVKASIESTTGGRLSHWLIGIDHNTRTVTVRVDLSLEQNRTVLAGIEEATATVDELQSTNESNPQLRDLLSEGSATPATVNDEQASDKATRNLLAGLEKLADNAANSFVIAEIPSSKRTGAELVTFSDGKMVLQSKEVRNAPNIRGGEWIRSDNGSICTTNFLWKKGKEYRIGTAGHCSTTTGTSSGSRDYRTFDHLTRAQNRNGRVGTVTHNGWVNNTRSDDALLTLPSAATPLSRISITATNYRRVTAVSHLSVLGYKGNPICHVGFGLKTTHGLDKSCGEITKSNVHLEYTLSTGTAMTIHGVYCTNAKVAGGDSGGPQYLEVFDDAWAVGITHSKLNTGDTCFTTVQAAEARHGYSIVQH